MATVDLLGIYAQTFRDNYDLPALTDFGSDKTLSYMEMAEEIARIHLVFEQVGVRRGDKIALIGKNSARWVTIFFATITYGAVIVPILPDFNHSDAQHIINHSDAVLLYASKSIYEAMDFDEMPGLRAAVNLDRREVFAQRSGVDFSRIYANQQRRFRQRYPDGFSVDDIVYPSLPPDTTVLINYTSGTTGFSKGVMLTLNNLAGNVVYGVNEEFYRPGDHALAFLPLSHAYGNAFDMLVPLACGAHVTLFGKTPSPSLLVKALKQVRPRLICMVPLILEKIYRKNIVPMISKTQMRWALAVPMLDKAIYSTIRRRLCDTLGGEFIQVIVGGAPLNREVEDFLTKIKFPFTVGYGMTECAPLISFTRYPGGRAGTCGRPIPCMNARILTDDPDKPGEIVVNGQNVMKGYYKNPEATNAVLDPDGSLHTGDMGTIDEDGFISIRGRYKTMILSASGQNIYPEEIESKINNMPYVAESLVVERDGTLVALVYPDYEEADASGLADAALAEVMEQMRTDINKLVAPYERIARIQLMPSEFQKTPKRSIKRFLYN